MLPNKIDSAQNPTNCEQIALEPLQMDLWLDFRNCCHPLPKARNAQMHRPVPKRSPKMQSLIKSVSAAFHLPLFSAFFSKSVYCIASFLFSFARPFFSKSVRGIAFFIEGDSISSLGRSFLHLAVGIALKLDLLDRNGLKLKRQRRCSLDLPMKLCPLFQLHEPS